MGASVSGASITSHVRTPEIEGSPFAVPWLLTSLVATRVLIAVADPYVVPLFAGDQVRWFFVAKVHCQL
jgi:hypothetical protein